MHILHQNTDLARLPALVLAGGFGTRLRSVTGDQLPKSLVSVGGRPFLDYVLSFLAHAGIRHVVLLVHHRAGAIRSHVGSGAAFGVRVEYSEESEPLGTAGAVALGARQLAAGPVLVLNGDSLAAVELARLVEFHQARRPSFTLAAALVDDAARYGRVRTDTEGRVLAFEEKHGAGPGMINAGIYLLEPEVIGAIPPGPASLERDVLPRFAGRGLAFPVSGYFIDTGVPEDYYRVNSDPAPLRALAGVAP